MNQKQLTIASVACGLACALCVAAYLASVQGEANAARAEVLARYGGEQIEVCVAARDISAGERVDASAVETRLWVADLLPEDPVQTPVDVVGLTVTSSILKGEVVSQKRFANERGSIDVPAGKSAVSVPAKAVRAVGGAVRPNMSVDVYSSGGTTTTLLARDVLVLDTSVGDSGTLLSSESGWITLAVDPDRVEEFVAAADRTDLCFVLPGQRVDETASDDASASSSNSSSAATAPNNSSSAPAATEDSAQADLPTREAGSKDEGAADDENSVPADEGDSENLEEQIVEDEEGGDAE